MEVEEEPIHTICANFLDGGLVQKRPIILACQVCGLKKMGYSQLLSFSLAGIGYPAW